MTITSVDLFVASMRAFHLERAAVCGGEAEPVGTIQREMYEAHMDVANLYDAMMGGDVERSELEAMQTILADLLLNDMQDWHEEHDQHALIAADIHAAAHAQVVAFLDR